MLENAEDIMHSLEEFSKLKPKVIPLELEDYLGYVAKTGDPVFKWSMVKYLFREKMLSVINDFYEDTLTIDLPYRPNVDVFNYDRMKTSLLERLESFHGAPFTIQRICELLTNPRKEYNRADKFMRAIEKNILVVSTREPGRYSDLDCETTQECSINGIREVGDSLDSTFIINDLGPGPDSSSPNSELNDPMPDANHLNTVERVSPVHDQEVSSDSDDSSVENGHVSGDRPSEKTNGVDSEQQSVIEEPDGANVSSTDMNLSLEDSDEIRCDEAVGNSVTSSHESVISNRPMGFVVGPNLDEVMGPVEGAPVENLEPCILPDESLLNEVITDPQPDTVKDGEKSESIQEMAKSDLLDTSEPVSGTVAMPNIVAVECDTSQIERNSKCDESAVNPNSIEGESEVPCDTNDQVTSCDTTEARGVLASGYLDSNQVQAESGITPSCDVAQSDIVAQSDVDQSDLAQSDVAQSDSELSDGAQSSVIDQSDLVQSVVPSDIAQSDNAAQSEEDIRSDTSFHPNVDEPCDYVAQTHNAEQSHDIAQSDEVTSDMVAQLGEVVQSNIDQIKQDDSESSHLNVEEPEVDSQTVSSDQSISVDQSCAVVTSEDLVPSEPMVQSSLSDQAESLQTENHLETELENQGEQIVRMDIPSDSDNVVVEPAQSNQPDCATSEPMDVDE